VTSLSRNFEHYYKQIPPKATTRPSRLADNCKRFKGTAPRFGLHVQSGGLTGGGRQSSNFLLYLRLLARIE